MTIQEGLKIVVSAGRISPENVTEKIMPVPPGTVPGFNTDKLAEGEQE